MIVIKFTSYLLSFFLHGLVFGFIQTQAKFSYEKIDPVIFTLVYKGTAISQEENKKTLKKRQSRKILTKRLQSQTGMEVHTERPNLNLKYSMRQGGRQGSRQGGRQGVITAGELKPYYPLQARRRGDEGEILVKIKVSPIGTAKILKIINESGSSILESSVKEVIQKAEFRPKMINNVAVSHERQLKFIFNLDEP